MSRRYVIRSAKGYYTEMKCTRVKPVYCNDELVGQQLTWRPKFDGAQPSHASVFDTAADAQALIDNPKFGGPKRKQGFADCTIEPRGV